MDVPEEGRKKKKNKGGERDIEKVNQKRNLANGKKRVGVEFAHANLTGKCTRNHGDSEKGVP